MSVHQLFRPGGTLLKLNDGSFCVQATVFLLSVCTFTAGKLKYEHMKGVTRERSGSYTLSALQHMRTKRFMGGRMYIREHKGWMATA